MIKRDTVTGPVYYRVTESWCGAVLYWLLSDGSGGSCQFSTPVAARRYAVQVEGTSLSWIRSGTLGFLQWETRREA